MAAPQSHYCYGGASLRRVSNSNSNSKSYSNPNSNSTSKSNSKPNSNPNSNPNSLIAHLNSPP